MMRALKHVGVDYYLSQSSIYEQVRKLVDGTEQSEFILTILRQLFDSEYKKQVKKLMEQLQEVIKTLPKNVQPILEEILFKH